MLEVQIIACRTQEFLKILARFAPLPNYLKRSQRSLEKGHNRLLVCRSDCGEEIIENLIQKLNLLRSDLKPILVCDRLAETRTQYQEWKLLWPISVEAQHFQRAKLTMEEIPIIQNNIKLLMTLEDTGMVVDPRDNIPISQAKMDLDVSLLDHCVMRLVENVSNCEKKRQTAASTGNVRKKETDGYYLTGLDVYLNEEPCAMCSMALVHSRVRRVFWIKSRSDGGLGSRYKFHEKKSLNHHFKVYGECDDWNFDACIED